jgi:hypothetical protein
VPLTGVAFVALVVAAILISGDPPDSTEDSAQEVVDFYQDHEEEQFLASVLGTLGGVFLLFFAGWLRKVLRDAEGPGGALSTVFFGGAVAFAVAWAVGASINVSLANNADDIDPVAMQALNALSWDYFLPFALGLAVMMLAAGISIVRHGALAAWLGWVAIVLGVASVTPAGFFAFLLAGVWILMVSVLLSRRARTVSPPPSTA